MQEQSKIEQNSADQYMAEQEKVEQAE